jgi:hypothetical protein
VQAISSDNIHRDPKQILQIRNQTGREPWAVDRSHLNEKINITLVSPFAARQRAEYAQVRNAMLLADFKNLLTLGLEKCFDFHNFIIQQSIFCNSAYLDARSREQPAGE